MCKYIYMSWYQLYNFLLGGNDKDIIDLDPIGAHNTIVQESPPQQHLLLIMILMTKLNKVGEREQHCRIPFIILNDSDNCPSTLSQVLKNEL